ncbi:Hypothetical predicted protein, partial [Pelobates cultripes]
PSLQATRNQTPYVFESIHLSFYADLSRPTLAWGRTMKHLTALLHFYKMKYQWIHHNDTSFKIQDIQGATDLLPTLGLHQDSMSHAGPSHTATLPTARDPTKVTQFVPRHAGAKAST